MLPTRQRQKNNMPQVMNARAVYGVLGLGFVLLLGLIVYLGRFSSTRLEDLSRGAEEKTRGYSARLQQAVSLRAAVENAIAEARAYQAARESLRVYPVSFSTRFNTARQRLSNEFGKAKTMRAQYGTQMSSAERQQLDEILSYEKPFLDFLVEVREQVDAEAKGKIEERQPREVVTPHDAAADAVLGKDADLLSKRDFAKSQFFSSQNFLLISSVSWQQRLEDERINLLADIAQQQAAAASSVRSRSFWTWVLGCLIAVATYLIVRYQIKQIRKANKDALEAEGLTTSVLNSLRDDVLAINEQGAVFSVNPAFLNDFHLAQQECLHQDYRTLLGRLPQLRQAVEQASQRAGTTPLPPERVEIKPDGVEGDTRLFDLEIAPR